MRSLSIGLVLRNFSNSLSKQVLVYPSIRRPVAAIDFCCRAVSYVEPMTPSRSAEHPMKRELENESVSDREPEGSTKRKRMKRKETPLFRACQSIYAAAKQNNREEAMDRFRSAREAGMELPQGVMNSVLYLLTGGEEWFEKASICCQPSSEPSDDRQELEECRDEILQYMKEQELMADEMVYIAQARLAACLGDPDMALTFANQMLNGPYPIRLRFFTPALLGFAQQGEMQKAIHVQELIAKAELDLTELEFRLLLKAFTQGPETYKQVSTLLLRIGNELTFLEKDTIEVARGYFASTHAGGAFSEGPLASKQMWLVEDVDVDEEGFSVTAGEKLNASDLADSDWTAFLKAFEELALSREKKEGPFAEFMSWIQRHGPFPLVIDGANVAFHKQNYVQGSFNFHQIAALVEFLDKQFPDRKVLLVLHRTRTQDKVARTPFAEAFLSNMAQKNQLYVTPVGNNDDWYWLCAALHAKGDGLLISNDECRDHFFQLLAPKYFLKWKERHLVRFEFFNDEPTIQLPSIYTCCTQQLTNGTWMLPYRNEEGNEKWLCAKPL